MPRSCLDCQRRQETPKLRFPFLGGDRTGRLQRASEEEESHRGAEARERQGQAGIKRFDLQARAWNSALESGIRVF